MKEPTKSEVQRKADKMETEKNDKIRKGEYQVRRLRPLLWSTRDSSLLVN